MGKYVAIEVQGNLDSLGIVWSVIDCVTAGIPEAMARNEERNTTMVAVQEILTNVLRHGYDCDCEQPIRVELEVEKETLQVTVIDRGPAFDPTSHVADDNDDHLPSEGGYGIAIVNAVMDSVDYVRGDSTNIMTMTKDFGLLERVTVGATGGGQ
jgi:anti-sigma regulatory factor (Ser/Thr protein kinase)